MNNNEKEKKVILIIRYSLPIFILVVTIIVSFLLSIEHRKNLKSEREFIEKQYIEDEKAQIKIDLENVYKYISIKEKELETDLKFELKDRLDNAYAVMNSIYQKNREIKTKAQILDDMKVALNDLRFSDGKGYFFIYTLLGDVILNPAFKKLEGKNLWNFRDSRGTPLLQEMNKILTKEEATYYNWYWKDPIKKDDIEYLKVGYFKKFAPYDIFIGTGFYKKDFMENLKKDIIDYISKLRYKDDKYIFVIDSKGNLIANKHTEILNQNIESTVRLNFLSDQVKLLRNKKSDEGMFFRYDLLLNPKSEPIEKISYMNHFKAWDWIIGTGFTMKSINSTVKVKQDFLTKKYEDYLDSIIFFAISFILVVLYISYILSKYIENSFLDYTKTLESQQSLLLKSQKIAKLGDWSLDLLNNKVFWSNSIYEILEIKTKKSKLTLDDFKIFFDENDWQKFKNALENSIKNESEYSETFKITKENQKIAWIDIGVELDKDNNRLNGIIQDVTDRKISELEKEEKDKLIYQQSKMAAMGEMIGNIAHQWRQPLSAISTAATGAKLKYDMGMLTNEDLTLIMNSINKSTQYLSQTIDDFRNFFNPSNKNRVKVSVKELIEKTYNLVKPQYVTNGIRIVDSITDIEITTLKNELIQVLINILNNSKDALLEKEIPQKLIFITTYKKEDKVVIEIHDNAKGIDEEIINRIFEPYFTTKHKSQGTGIGLYMSQEIIHKLLHGKLEVSNCSFSFEDKDYYGAKFKITLDS